MLLLALATAIALTAAAIAGWSPWRAPAPSLVAPVIDVTLPPVLPVVTLDVAPPTARLLNAAVPFARVPNPAAKPFRFAGTAADARGAETCLAAAAWYEAGDDAVGQAAVIQVVLNRLRHPAFPHSVCGVVLQGAERITGCQFSFACDGSLSRRAPSVAAAIRAHAAARYAMRGGVFALVGGATHYHTDEVVPRWSSAMDKLLFLHGHLFFRWHGAAGERRMFTAHYAGGEIPRLLTARLVLPAEAPAEAAASDVPATAGADPAIVPAEVAHGTVIRSDEWRGIFYLYLAPSAFPGSYAVKAVQACARRQQCIVYGWGALDKVPVAVTETRPTGLAFAYVKRSGMDETAEWDCRRFPRHQPAQCLSGTQAPDRPSASTQAATTRDAVMSAALKS